MAIVEDVTAPVVWDQEAGEVFGKYSMNQNFESYSMNDGGGEARKAEAV